MRRVRSGELGKSRLVITKMVRQSNMNDPSDAWRLDMTKSGGGALADMGIYGINGARYLLNEEPVEVRATARTDRSDPRFKTIEDFYSWEFKFPSGAIAQGSTSFDASDTMAYEVYGEHKRIVADPGCFYDGNHLTLVQGGARTEIPIHEIDQFAREMDWMADVVRGKAPMLSPGEEGVQDMRLIKAIMDFSSERRRTGPHRFWISPRHRPGRGREGVRPSFSDWMEWWGRTVAANTPQHETAVFCHFR